MIAIRLLSVGDVDAYRSLRLEALRDSPTAFCSSHEEESPRPVESFMARLRENQVFGAFTENNRLVGILGFVRETRIKRAHTASLVGMYVAPAFRRQGIGGALLDHALLFARGQPGLRSVTLSVMSSQPAASRLYRSRGFKAFGLEPGALFFDGKYYDEELLILRLDELSTPIP